MSGRRRGAVVGLVLTATLAAGCGGGGGGDDAGDDPVGRLDQDSRAQSVNLRLTDFPQGWERSRATSSPQGEADRAFAACMGRPDPATLRLARVDSDNFSTGELTRANSSVQVMRSVEQAKADIDVLRSSQAVPCLVTRINAELTRQATLGTPAYQQQGISRVEAPNVGDHAAAFRVNLATSDAQGRPVAVFVDLIYVQKGDVQISASLINPGTPFSPDLAATLAEKMAARA